MKEMITVSLFRNSGSLTLKGVLRPRCRNSTVVRAGLVAHAFQDYVYPDDRTQPTYEIILEFKPHTSIQNKAATCNFFFEHLFGFREVTRSSPFEVSRLTFSPTLVVWQLLHRYVCCKIAIVIRTCDFVQRYRCYFHCSLNWISLRMELKKPVIFLR